MTGCKIKQMTFRHCYKQVFDLLINNPNKQQQK